MNLENFQTTLEILSRQRPFKPFTLEFNSSYRVEVHHPEAVDLLEELIVYRDTQGDFTIFDASSVTRFIQGIQRH